MQASTPSFIGTSPGQKLEELVDRFNQDNLKALLGQDILDLIYSLEQAPDKPGTLRRIAVSFLRERADETLTRQDVRKICLDAMTGEKLEELARRIGISDLSSLQQINPRKDAKTWRTFLGFFGIDVRYSAPFVAALDQEVVRARFGLFPHQRKAADRVGRAIQGGHGRVVLHMPTGAGKTRTAMHVICQYLTAMEPCVVIWLASSSELLEQAVEAFQIGWGHLGNRDIDLLRLWGDHDPAPSSIPDGLVIAGLQKIHAFKNKYPIGFLRLAKCINLVVVDEAHQAIAPTYRETIEALTDTGTHAALLGLTATPGRSWSDIAADEQLSEFFDGRKVMLQIEGWNDPVEFLMAEGYLARPTFKRIEVSSLAPLKPQLYKPTRTGDYDPVVLDFLSKQLERNLAIVKEALRLIELGHTRIILFGASVRHAEMLAGAFSALGIDGRVLTGKTAANSRERIIGAFRQPSTQPMILCNFGVLTTGFDAPNTSAAIIARPTKSLVLFSQMIGRATRGPRAGGNETCEVSTVVDIDLPGFGDVADAFTNWEDVWNDPR